MNGNILEIVNKSEKLPIINATNDAWTEVQYRKSLTGFIANSTIAQKRELIRTEIESLQNRRPNLFIWTVIAFGFTSFCWLYIWAGYKRIPAMSINQIYYPIKNEYEGGPAKNIDLDQPVVVKADKLTPTVGFFGTRY